MEKEVMELNKEFWQTVQKEFEKSTNTFLCNGSNTFRKAFHSDLEESIRETGKVYLFQLNNTEFQPGAGGVLFDLSGYKDCFEVRKQKQRDLRKNFLNFVISNS
jgi:hypothetical protein